MRAYYEFTNLNNTEARITKITPSNREGGNFIEISDELGKRFLQDKEFIRDWKLVWDDAAENLVMKRKGEEVYSSLPSGFLEIEDNGEDADIVIEARLPPYAPATKPPVVFVVTMYEPPEDPTMPVYFFVTKKGDPNVLYAEFSSLYYDAESRFSWYDPEADFSIFAKTTGLTYSLIKK